jgi:antitoxin component YwqK of YwqJK toxin-antitoxin module
MNDLVNSMAQTILQLEEENAKLKERLEQFEAASKDTEPTMTNELTPYIKYHPNGNVWIKGQKNSKRQREGIWEWFYKNGNTLCRTPYKDGNEDGIEEWFDEQGNITETRHWNDGELIETTEN